MLLEKVRVDTRCGRRQRMEYHLRKLEDNNLISITYGWEYKKDQKSKMDHKKRTITLTSLGSKFAKFPDLVGSLP